jgi:hypothetical protein
MKITDAGLEFLAGQTGLKELDLSGTHITDGGLKHLKGLAGLETLRLSQTQITYDGIEEIHEAIPNCHIEHRRFGPIAFNE